MLDDYSALSGVTVQSMAQDAALFPLRDTYQFTTRDQVRAAPSDWTAPNPPYGAVLTYNVGAAAPAGTTWAIAISDASGKEVRRLDLPNDLGVKRVVWNLAGAPPPAPAADPAASTRRRSARSSTARSLPLELRNRSR